MAVDGLTPLVSRKSGWLGAGAPAQERWLLWLALAFVAVFSLLPAVYLALQMGLALLGPTRAAVLATLASNDAWHASQHTLEVGVGGAALALIYGLVFALFVSLTPARPRQWLVFAFVVQALLPPQVVALAWTQLWLPLKNTLIAQGWDSWQAISNPLQSREGIILLLGIHYAPLVFLTVRAGLLNLSPEVIEAARVCGASPRSILRRVILPLVLPALVAGGALAFVSCIGNFGIPAFLGIPGEYLVLPTLIYRELSGFGPAAIPSALVLSALVALLAALGMGVQRVILRCGSSEVIATRLKVPPFHLGRWQTPVAIGLTLWVSLLLLAPLLALLAKSVSPGLGIALTWQNLSLEHYSYVLLHNDATLRAFVNSVSLSVGSAVVLATVSLFLAYQMAYRRNVLLRRLMPWIEVPYVIPGVVLSIAMILLYIKPLPLLGWSFYNTLWIIFFAYLARFLTIQLRPVLSGFMQMPREMLEAAQVFGGSFVSRMWHIVLPLILPSVTAGALLVMLLSLNELTVSALLWATGTETLGVLVFGLEQGGESAAASAVGIISIVITLLCMLLASRLGRRLPEGVLPWRA
ncbi:iron ABC transporter permease [Rhodoferax sp. U11-2br]|uniref:ABC transporter permease n=1 Tax=Rhodoferax sp. U11-2br TaxID=2838878 RepID=UPI001BEBBC27|nr:iron ABC transporter permease [Rhodoferax sp. U11-2br]MBT3068383.1 iron ABC transporter permease [Rhodoferax sp. U11-2br]